jgi:hypothetical protein
MAAALLQAGRLEARVEEGRDGCQLDVRHGHAERGADTLGLRSSSTTPMNRGVLGRALPEGSSNGERSELVMGSRSGQRIHHHQIRRHDGPTTRDDRTTALLFPGAGSLVDGRFPI